VRLQSLSLHRGDGELLWLSEGVFGPDEHGFVLDALDLFALEADRALLERRLEEGRRALFVAARTPLGECCGLALAIIEERSARTFEAELSTPNVSALMRSFSMLLAPPLAAPAKPAPEVALTLSPEPAAPAPLRASVAARAPTAARAFNPSGAAPSPPRPKAAPSTAAAPRVSVRAKAAPPKPSAPASAEVGALHVRRYLRLRPGGSTRRFEVIGAPIASLEADQRLSARVIEHLQRMQEHYRQNPASIAIPLSVEAVSSSEFLALLCPALQRAELPAGTLGFCLPAPAWAQSLQRTQQFMETCAQCGCFVALDDFNLDRSGFTLLRSSALRCLKLDPELISQVMSDKFAQASVAAIVQAARVLGLYCVAKQVHATPLAKWLASAGIEFQDPITGHAETTGATTTGAQVLALERLS